MVPAQNPRFWLGWERPYAALEGRTLQIHFGVVTISIVEWKGVYAVLWYELEVCTPRDRRNGWHRMTWEPEEREEAVKRKGRRFKRRWAAVIYGLVMAPRFLSKSSGKMPEAP